MVLEFSEKDKKRGIRQAKSTRVRIKRTHKRIHLGGEIRPEATGRRAAGILAKTGIHISQPASADWRNQKTKISTQLGASTPNDAEIAAEHAFVASTAMKDYQGQFVLMA